MQFEPYDDFPGVHIFELDSLLQDLHDTQGTEGLADFARHLLQEIHASKVDLAHYAKPVEEVSRWLADRPVTQSPQSEECLRSRKSLQNGGASAACIGLGKCHSPLAAVHFVALHLLRGLDVDQLVQASKHYCTFFYFLSLKPDLQHLGRDADVAEARLKLWLLKKLGRTY